MPIPLTQAELQEVAQAVAQAVQAAGQQQAQQNAQQIAEQVAQAVSQAVSKVMQSQTQTTGSSTTAARVENADIGGSERLEKENIDDSGIMFANAKRTYDEYQHESLESIKRNRTHIDIILSNAEANNQKTEAIKIQALQNAVETANMVGKNSVVNIDNVQKQHTAHRDIATDRTWNVNETDYAAVEILRDNTFKEAIAAAVSDAVARMNAAKA